MSVQDVFRRFTSPTLKKLYRFVLKLLVGRFLDKDITLEVHISLVTCIPLIPTVGSIGTYIFTLQLSLVRIPSVSGCRSVGID